MPAQLTALPCPPPPWPQCDLLPQDQERYLRLEAEQGGAFRGVLFRAGFDCGVDDTGRVYLPRDHDLRSEPAGWGGGGGTRE